jgi:hypothetical protein
LDDRNPFLKTIVNDTLWMICRVLAAIHLNAQAEKLNLVLLSIDAWVWNSSHVAMCEIHAFRPGSWAKWRTVAGNPGSVAYG